MVERFQILLKKDEILSNKIKKIAIRDFFADDDNLLAEKNTNNKKGKKHKNIEIDIFSESFDKKKKEKTRKKIDEKKIKQDLCTATPKYELKEKYKYHQTHHGEFNNKLIRIQQNEIKTLASYNPKMDFIWKKIITGPQWKLLKGRRIMYKSNNINIDKSLNGKKNNHLNNNKGLVADNNSKKCDSMDKQTKRGYLPTSYDLRIRTDKAFIQKIDLKKVKNKSNNNIINNSEDNFYNNDKKII